VWEFALDMHPAQREVFESDARFKVVAAGRRFGKTLFAAATAIMVAASKPEAIVWWVSPSHDQSRIALRMVAKAIPREHREVNKTLSEIYLSNGGRIAFKSGERSDNLRGEGLDLVIVDEAAFVSEALWTQALRPTLSDKGGKALLISTFDGENWFYDLWCRSRDPEQKAWAGWKFPTGANPYIPADEIEEARRNLPKEEFEQEYMANPMAFAGAVFDGEEVDRAWQLGKEYEPHAGTIREAGLDWGWNVTAFEVAEETVDGKIAWIDEEMLYKTELTVKCEIICRHVAHHNIAIIYADAAGADENVTLAMMLEEKGLACDVQPVPFNAYKKTGILTRRFYHQHEREILGPNCHQLLMDSKSYHYSNTPGQEEKPAKGKDHSVDAATALYASRSYVLGDREPPSYQDEAA